MHHTPKTYQSLVLEKTLLHVPFDGWTMKSLLRGAKDAGLPETIVQAVFPTGIPDALSAYALMMDDRMMDRLMTKKPAPQKISEKISQGVLCRFEALMPYKEAEKLAVTYWLRPIRKWQGAKILWRTADRLWVYAGDTSKDYNYYTKRALLSGVISSTLLYWLNDHSNDLEKTRAFLDRRIQNVLSIGGALARLKKARP